MKVLSMIFILGMTMPSYAQHIYKRSLKLMGSRFDITIVEYDSIKADILIDKATKEISRIEKLISSWDPDSETSLINKNAGIKPIVVSSELFELISRSIKISQITDGAFDISYASLDKIWFFDTPIKQLPSKKAVSESVGLVGYENIILDYKDNSVFLTKRGMKIGFGAIGKGYAAEQAKKLMIKEGARSGIINASGDLTTWGYQPDGREWIVAITNPKKKDQAYAMLPISNSAMVTSGNYEKHVTIEGKHYSHIIDPKSGIPTNGILSVSVFAPSAELADALATGVFVLGIEVGIDKINQLPQIECIIIDEEGDIHTSNQIQIKAL